MRLDDSLIEFMKPSESDKRNHSGPGVGPWNGIFDRTDVINGTVLVRQDTRFDPAPEQLRPAIIRRDLPGPVT